MLSIEEIKLLIEKLEKAKESDFKKIIDDSLTTLKSLAESVDIKNQHEINRLDKTKEWYAKDMDWRHERKDQYDQLLYDKIFGKIGQFNKMGSQSPLFNSLEIGPGYGRFSRCFLAWKLNYFLDIMPWFKSKIFKLFHPAQHKYIRFYTTDRTACPDIPDNAVNFVFSWDTFTFFTQEHIKEYLSDINRVILPGGYVFIHYCNCEYDYDLKESKRGYWNYNTKSLMKKIIDETGYKILEMDQFKPGANYAIFQKPGNENPVLYQSFEIPAEK